MPEQFERIADYARRTSVLDDVAGIRAKGTRRIRRRRAGQATLGVGALAVVTGIGATMAMSSPGHSNVSTGAASSYAPTHAPTTAHATAAPSSTSSSGSAAASSEATSGNANSFASPGSSALIPRPGSSVSIPADATLTISRDGTVTDYYLDVQAPGAAKVVYGLSAQKDGVLQALQLLGFDHVTLRGDSSAQTYARYPVDFVTDIQNSSSQSVLDKTISTSTALVIVYCANPNG